MTRDWAAAGAALAAPAGTGPAGPDASQAGSSGYQPDGVMSKAAAENFPVALRALPRRYRRHLLAVYQFARTVDDIGDLAPPGDRASLLAGLERDLRHLYEPGGPGRARQLHQAVAGLAGTIAECRIPMQPFADLIKANQQDQVVARYRSFTELAGYCELSANPVGRIVLQVFGRSTPERVLLSDSICTGLQLAEHLQDVAEDLRAGRIYLPADDMAGHGVSEQDLAARTASGPVRELIAFEVRRTRMLLDAGAPLVGTLRGVPRLAISGYLAGGRAALAAIARADYDVLAGPPRPRKSRTLAELAAAFGIGR
jgi:squalene synthase HpnC